MQYREVWSCIMQPYDTLSEHPTWNQAKSCWCKIQWSITISYKTKNYIYVNVIRKQINDIANVSCLKFYLVSKTFICYIYLLFYRLNWLMYLFFVAKIIMILPPVFVNTQCNFFLLFISIVSKRVSRNKEEGCHDYRFNLNTHLLVL